MKSAIRSCAAKIGLMREGDISTKKFRELTAEIARLLAYEACQDFLLETVEIRGWAGPVRSSRSRARRSPWCPSCAPGWACRRRARHDAERHGVSVVGIARDEETLQPVPYFEKLSASSTSAWR